MLYKKLCPSAPRHSIFPRIFKTLHSNILLSFGATGDWTQDPGPPREGWVSALSCGHAPTLHLYISVSTQFIPGWKSEPLALNYKQRQHSRNLGKRIQKGEGVQGTRQWLQSTRSKGLFDVACLQVEVSWTVVISLGGEHVTGAMESNEVTFTAPP